MRTGSSTIGGGGARVPREGNGEGLPPGGEERLVASADRGPRPVGGQVAGIEVPRGAVGFGERNLFQDAGQVSETR